ncbi:SAM-dependent methyltransferase [Derxia gummosa]|uniref:SAM-dependent methyltransferase n=1 Tax=Derxia gummosa DSM 723 TaxID=1121388 RepID=A0A8B6X3A7_9BURK|nr:cyclopropane-fatty-acyl-phospholipid synthase family protein [Derxia gummosa]
MFWESRLEHFVDRLRASGCVPLELRLWNGRRYDLAGACGVPPVASVVVPSPRSLGYLLRPSLSSLGRAYVEGAIEVEGRLSDVIEASWKLATTAVCAEGRFARLLRGWHHTRASDRADIAYHYDVSNDFYRLWLDERMVYSCAYFEHGDETLAEAQRRKLDHILTKLRVGSGDRLLDIGCGWGALVIHAAKHYGAVCHGITLSEQQHALATERVRAEGLQGRVTIELRDYRDMLPAHAGGFDRISSVGMFEHVGKKHLADYFGIIHGLLKDGGLVLNHGITSTDPADGETPYGGGEFIHDYVFPHGELVHIGTVLQEMQRGGLEPHDIESLRRHYALTLDHWAARFEAHADEARRLAGDRRFRIWRVYLAGCAKAFREDWISVFQVLGCKAGGGALNPLPMSRGWQYGQGR